MEEDVLRENFFILRTTRGDVIKHARPVHDASSPDGADLAGNDERLQLIRSNESGVFEICIRWEAQSSR